MEAITEVVATDIYKHEKFGDLRTVRIDGLPWFVGRDVAAALEYKDTVNALKSHVDDEDKARWQITTQYGNKEAVFINESGLYSLILSSKMDKAREFKHWVTAEVIPEIVRKGYYIRPDVAQIDTPLTREDLVCFYTYFTEGAKEYFANFVEANMKFVSEVDARLEKIERGYSDICGSYADMRESHTALKEGYNALRDGYSILRDNYVISQNRADNLAESMTELLKKLADLNAPQETSWNLAKHDEFTNLAKPDEFTNPAFVNTIPYDRIKEWRENFWKAATIIGAVRNKSKAAGRNEIYDEMRNRGVALTELHEEYVRLHDSHNSIASMIFNSDILRSYAEDAIHVLYKKYFPEKYKSAQTNSPEARKVYKSQLMLSTPPEVKELIQAFADKENLTYMSVAARVYREVEERSGVNLKDAARKFAADSGVMHCTKAYYISQVPELMRVLMEIAA